MYSEVQTPKYYLYFTATFNHRPKTITHICAIFGPPDHLSTTNFHLYVCRSATLVHRKDSRTFEPPIHQDELLPTFKGSFTSSECERQAGFAQSGERLSCHMLQGNNMLNPTNACTQVLSYHASCKEVSRCHTRGESEEYVACRQQCIHTR